MLRMRPIRFILITLCCFIAGGLTGMVFDQAPDVEARVRLQQELDNSRAQTEQYRRRCVDWSHYVWNLEHSRQDSAEDNGDNNKE